MENTDQPTEEQAASRPASLPAEVWLLTFALFVTVVSLAVKF